MAQSKHIQTAIDSTLAHIQKHAPEEFQQLERNPTMKETVVKAAHDAVTEHLKIAQEFHTNPTADISSRLSKHLPKHCLEAIQSGLKTSSHRLNISKKDDGHHRVDISHDGEEIGTSKRLILLN